jgi:hydroxyacylglutathione hydrolase
MEIIKLKPLSVCDTNSYIVATNEGNAVLIDAPADADYIYGEILKHGLTLKKILLTHGHFDHVGAVADLVEKTGCKVYIHEMDQAKLSEDTDGLLINLFRVRGYKPFDKSIAITEDDIIKQDELEFDVLNTPGHTSGSVCYITGDVMFSGDTLFARSVGRTDMPDGNYSALMYSMEKIKDLGGNLRILPGHMCETSLDSERKYNPYLI